MLTHSKFDDKNSLEKNICWYVQWKQSDPGRSLVGHTMKYAKESLCKSVQNQWQKEKTEKKSKLLQKFFHCIQTKKSAREINQTNSLF